MQTRVFEIYDNANKDISAVCEILKNVVSLNMVEYQLVENARKDTKLH